MMKLLVNEIHEIQRKSMIFNILHKKEKGHENFTTNIVFLVSDTKE